MPIPVVVALTDDLINAAAYQLVPKWIDRDLTLAPAQLAELATDLRQALESAALVTGQVARPQPDLFGGA